MILKYWKYLLGAFVFLCLVGVLTITIIISRFSSKLPKIIKAEDYAPLKVTEVFDRNGEKIGEFLRERRIVIDIKTLPPYVVQAFIAAEDSDFYKHTGINLQAIFRAMIANLRAGRTVQGGSTITQQVAKQILLTSERSIDRKIKEAILARRMEKDLTKEEILYLYLNQIYFGQGAYGIEMASQVYFKKPAAELQIHEAAILAGLPKAPSSFSPVRNPQRAKVRQLYVLSRMKDDKYITEEQRAESAVMPIKVNFMSDYKEVAPYFLETVRLLLIAELGEETVLDKGLKVYTSLDLEKHRHAQEALKKGLKDLDKRQGYRGPIKNLAMPADVLNFLAEKKKELLNKQQPFLTIDADGKLMEDPETSASAEGNALVLSNPNTNQLPSFISTGDIIQGVVSKVSDKHGFVEVQLPDATGLIDFESMKWARKPDPSMMAKFAEIKFPSQALKAGDVIEVLVVNSKINTEAYKKLKPEVRKQIFQYDTYVHLELEQEPEADAALLSLDQETQEIIAMVGGYSFERTEYNKAIQAARQTGSSFKPIVYAAALDKGFQPNTEIFDIPIVFKEEDKEKSTKDETIYNKYKPANHSRDFHGDVLFRDALIRSLNIPTIRITDSVGVNWVTAYARRLGIFSPLNNDITLSLGSSGVTLYEMTKVYSLFGRMGKRVRPLIIKKVFDESGEVLLENLSLDKRFQEEILNQEQQWQERVIERQVFGDVSDKFIFERDEDQLIKPQTAYVMTDILRGVIFDEQGTARSASSIGRPLAGKTGTTDNYYDAWFMGYSAQIATGVWVGYDQERSLGRGEVGGRAALPIWIDYMREAHKGLPVVDFPVPSGIVVAEIDGKTGKLATEYSERKYPQAFEEGQEPQETTGNDDQIDEKEFLKEDLSG